MSQTARGCRLLLRPPQGRARRHSRNSTGHEGARICGRALDVGGAQPGATHAGASAGCNRLLCREKYNGPGALSLRAVHDGACTSGSDGEFDGPGARDGRHEDARADPGVRLQPDRDQANGPPGHAVLGREVGGGAARVRDARQLPEIQPEREAAEDPDADGRPHAGRGRADRPNLGHRPQRERCGGRRELAGPESARQGADGRARDDRIGSEAV